MEKEDMNLWIKTLIYHLQNEYSQNTINRGVSYAMSGRVKSLQMPDKESLTAQVMGSRPKPYKTILTLIRDQIETDCSCPVRLNCKHAYSVGLMVLYGAWVSGVNLSRDTRSLLPHSWKNKRQAPDLSLLNKIRSLWESSSKTPSPGEKTGKKWWVSFLKAKNQTEKQEILERAIRSRIPERFHHFYYWHIGDSITKLLKLPNPFNILRNFERTLKQLDRHLYMSLLPPDPGLEEYLNSEEGRRIEWEIRQKEGLRRFIEWLNTHDKSEIPESPSQAEAVWLPQPQLEGIPQISFQLLVTSNRMERKPRTAQGIKQIRNDMEAGRRRFPQKVKSLILWLCERLETQFFGYPDYCEGEERTILPVTDVFSWMNLWGQTGLIRWKDGGDVRLAPHPAKLSIARTEDGFYQWIIALPHEDETGETRHLPLHESACMAEKKDEHKETLIFTRVGDTLYRLETGGMTYSLFSAIKSLPFIPFDQISGTYAGSKLSEWLNLKDDPWCRDFSTQYIPVRPVLEFRLGKDLSLSVTCLARTSEGHEFYRTPLGKWLPSPVKSQNRVKGKGKLEEITTLPQEEGAVKEQDAITIESEPSQVHSLALATREQDIQPVEEWLSRLIPRKAMINSDARGYYPLEWPLYRKDIAEFIKIWYERPRRVEWLGNREFKNLVTPKPMPRWSIRMERSGMNWLSVSLEMEKEIQGLSLKEIQDILDQTSADLVVLPGAGVYRRQELADFRKTLDLLNDLGLEPAPQSQRLHVLQLCGEAGKNLMVLAGRDEQFKPLAAQAQEMFSAFQGVPQAPVDQETKKLLRPYQHYGVDFISWACQTFGGAILADDMGLGKTFQVLAMLQALRSGEKDHSPSLVICPASVVHNWQREAARFTPGLKVGIIERGKGRVQFYKQLDTYDLLITNYSLARRDREILKGKKWFLVCVDEAQTIKNPHAGISKAVKDLESRYRISLTGTPVENRILDLWSIVDFILPNFLSSLSTFEKKWRESDNASFYRLLRARLRPVLLRRMKSEVAPELPPRIEERRDCEMTPEQKKTYLAELKKTRLMLQSTKTDQIVGKERILILSALTRLRQICCDPEIIGLKDKGSGKTIVLMELLEEILETGHKVLVFSQFVRMLNRLIPSLESRQIPFYLLTGQTRKRKELVDAFEKDARQGVFLISLKAGGLGLNLVSASHVILFDPWWNPAVEAQAIDRTHRIGQDKTVVAFRLVTLGTIEERILELQEKKRNLVKNILEEEAFNRTLTREDFAFLLESKED
jgi:SNF2 family DNA or RNA helicase